MATAKWPWPGLKTAAVHSITAQIMKNFDDHFAAVVQRIELR
jgi:hypothetical protein